MKEPFAENLLWVLDPADCGGEERIVEVAKQVGYGLIVKYHDGDPIDDDKKWQFRAKFKKTAILAQRAGVSLYAWGYCYGKNPELEGQTAAEVGSLGALGYVIDAESEWEVPGARALVSRFMSTVKRLAPDLPLAYSTFWNLRFGHSNFPAQAFVDQGCVAAIPQTYFGYGKWSLEQQMEMVQVAAQDFGGLPVYLAGSMNHSVRRGDLLNFLDLVNGRPHSLWLLDQVPGFQLDLLRVLQDMTVLDKIRELVR